MQYLVVIIIASVTIAKKKLYTKKNKELAFGLVPKIHSLYVGSYEYEIQMKEIICCSNKGIK